MITMIVKVGCNVVLFGEKRMTILFMIITWKMLLMMMIRFGRRRRIAFERSWCICCLICSLKLSLDCLRKRSKSSNVIIDLINFFVCRVRWRGACIAVTEATGIEMRVFTLDWRRWWGRRRHILIIHLLMMMESTGRGIKARSDDHFFGSGNTLPH